MQKCFHWLRKRKQWLQWSGISLLGVGILAIFVGGYTFRWGWTGFNKTLWDWMQLLIIPAALAVVGFLFNRTERRREHEMIRQQAETERQAAEQRIQSERQLAEQRTMTERFLTQWRIEEELKRKDEYQREALLQAYLDRMSDLLIEKGLRGSAPGDEVRNIARARTLTVLRRLDPERKADVLWFLYESHLLDRQGNKRIVDVSDADWSHIHLDGSLLRQIDLSGVGLSYANLQEVGLPGANLQGASLCQADLRGANLRGANLSGADLTQAKLEGADLTNATLKGADLSHADLTNALLQRSVLRDALLQGANLTNANLQGATYAEEQLATTRSWRIIR